MSIMESLLLQSIGQGSQETLVSGFFPKLEGQTLLLKTQVILDKDLKELRLN